MKITADNKLKKLIVVGDRVLIRPAKESEKTESGLYLPPGVQEKEKIQRGFVIKVGPGYPLPMPADEDDLWKGKDDQIKYLPLQAQEGDLPIVRFTFDKATKKMSGELDYQGTPVYFDGLLAGEQMTGNMSAGGTNFPFTATRQK